MMTMNKTAMTRAEVIDQAKQIVLGHGPSNCLEFTTELLEGRGIAEGAPDFETVYAEVQRQARRVYAFLGYESPFGR